MSLGKETRVPNIIPIRRESMKLDRPTQGAFSSNDKPTSIFAAREQNCRSAPADADSNLPAGLRAGSPSAVDELLRLYQEKIFNLAMSILRNESDEGGLRRSTQYLGGELPGISATPWLVIFRERVSRETVGGSGLVACHPWRAEDRSRRSCEPEDAEQPRPSLCMAEGY